MKTPSDILSAITKVLSDCPESYSELKVLLRHAQYECQKLSKISVKKQTQIEKMKKEAVKKNKEWLDSLKKGLTLPDVKNYDIKED